jgi:hypothetical protein
MKQDKDYSMISEDKSQTANLPAHTIVKDWADVGRGTPEVYDDSISGIDKQITDDTKKMFSQMKPKK